MLRRTSDSWLQTLRFVSYQAEGSTDARSDWQTHTEGGITPKDKTPGEEGLGIFPTASKEVLVFSIYDYKKLRKKFQFY